MPEVELPSDKSDRFVFHAYSRSSLILGDNFKSVPINPNMTPAGRYDGALGLLGNEKDVFFEGLFSYEQNYENGAHTRYNLMMSDQNNSLNDWTAEESTFNVRQANVEFSHLPSFTGPMENTILWAGKRFYPDELGIFFLGGVGAGIQDIQLGENWDTDISFVGRSFGDPAVPGVVYPGDVDDADDEGAYSTDALVLSNSHHIGNWYLMLSAMSARDNDKRDIDGEGVAADTGLHAMVAYKDDDSFYGLGDGNFRAALLMGKGLGAQVVSLGVDQNLIDSAEGVRVETRGTTYITPDWRIEPWLAAFSGRNRYSQGDKQDWVTLTVRLVNEVNRNFEMQYETTYQWMNIDPAGLTYEDDDVTRNFRPIEGSYRRFTVAPTIKPKVGGFLVRPEIRFFASWSNWDKSINRFCRTDSLGRDNFDGNEWTYGIQMETWF